MGKFLFLFMLCAGPIWAQSLPTQAQVDRFLKADDETKALVFTKLFVLEHATKEDGTIKIDFPIIQVVVKKDGQIVSQALTPATIFIGTEELNLQYDVFSTPIVSVSIAREDDLWLRLAFGVGGAICGFAVGYVLGGNK